MARALRRCRRDSSCAAAAWARTASGSGTVCLQYAHSTVAVWLFGAGLLTPEGGRVTFTAEQGDGLGRPGRLQIELTVSDGRPSRVRVGGRAVTVLTASLRVGD